MPSEPAPRGCFILEGRRKGRRVGEAGSSHAAGISKCQRAAKSLNISRNGKPTLKYTTRAAGPAKSEQARTSHLDSPVGPSCQSLDRLAVATSSSVPTGRRFGPVGPGSGSWSCARSVGRGNVKAIIRERDVIYASGFWRRLMLTIRVIPERVLKRTRF